MKKPTIKQKLIAKELRVYEKDIEKYYSERKRKLFSVMKNSSRVLEIGAGTGLNFKYYLNKIRLIVVEPNPLLHSDIKRKARGFGIKTELKYGFVENLPLKSNSVDFVVSTLVLCSVKDLKKGLQEIRRVLKKNGRFLFIEHVADKKGSFRRVVQNLAVLPWSYFGDGCHPNRNIADGIQDAGFKKVEIEEYYQENLGMIGWVVKPHVVGSAWKSEKDI